MHFKEKVFIAIQIGQALTYMHTNDIVHLDLKPENILVSVLKSDLIVLLATSCFVG